MAAARPASRQAAAAATMTAADGAGAGGAADLAGLARDPSRNQIRAGRDPLGEAFCALRSRADRRLLGQTFTPQHVIDSMIAWSAGTP